MDEWQHLIGVMIARTRYYYPDFEATAQELVDAILDGFVLRGLIEKTGPDTFLFPKIVPNENYLRGVARIRSGEVFLKDREAKLVVERVRARRHS
jgi:hypothetical protein